MDYEKLIRAIINPIVEEPESVLVRIDESDDGKRISITIASEREDTARLIGRRGIVASSIREVISIASKSKNQHVHVNFESFGEEKED